MPRAPSAKMHTVPEAIVWPWDEATVQNPGTMGGGNWSAAAHVKLEMENENVNFQMPKPGEASYM